MPALLALPPLTRLCPSVLPPKLTLETTLEPRAYTLMACCVEADRPPRGMSITLYSDAPVELEPLDAGA